VEAEDDTEDGRDELDEAGDLRGDRPRVGVDVQSLGLDVGRLSGHELVEVGVRHELVILLEALRDLVF
jgi:hypothetical protein